MTNHAFQVGQSIRLLASTLRPGGAGVFEIVALMPEEHGDCQYRVRSTQTSQQRVVQESQIAAL